AVVLRGRPKRVRSRLVLLPGEVDEPRGAARARQTPRMLLRRRELLQPGGDHGRLVDAAERRERLDQLRGGGKRPRIEDAGSLGLLPDRAQALEGGGIVADEQPRDALRAE